MSKSLAIAVICGLGLVAFGAGCGSADSGTPSNGMAGSTGGTTDPTAGAGGAGAHGGAAGEAGGGAGGQGGMMGGVGGAGGNGGGVPGGDGGGGGGGDSGQGDTGVNDGKSWTHLGYDQSNTYHNPFETKITVANAPMLMNKWTFPTASVPHGGLSIAEGKVFASTTGGTYGIDLAKGTQVWFNADVKAESTPAYHDGAVYVHSIGAILHKLDAATGNEIWKSEKTYNIAGSDGTSSAVIGGDKVIVGHSAGLNETSGVLATTAMSKGGVEAFYLETGKRAWSYPTCDGDEDGAMVWSTVAIDLEMGVVFAATGNNYTVAGANSDSIHAIELETGKRVWRTQVREGDQWSSASANSDDTDFGANPILAKIGDREVVAAGDKGAAFWVLDRVKGDIIWKKEDLSPSHSAANGGVLNNGAFDGTRFYVSSNHPAGPNSVIVHGLNAADGTAAWPAKTFPKITWGMPSVANGVLAVPVNDTLYIFNAATGDMLNTFETGGSIAAGAPAIADGMIVVKSGLSYIYADIFGTGVNNSEIHGYGLP